MARKAKESNPDAVVQRLREAQTQLRSQSDRASRAADTLGQLITQLEAEVRAAEPSRTAVRRTS